MDNLKEIAYRKLWNKEWQIIDKCMDLTCSDKKCTNNSHMRKMVILENNNREVIVLHVSKL